MIIRFLHEEEGQALIEYVLALAVIITIVTLLATGFRKTLYQLWEFYSKQISAPCPGCPAAANVRFK